MPAKRQPGKLTRHHPTTTRVLTLVLRFPPVSLRTIDNSAKKERSLFLLICYNRYLETREAVCGKNSKKFLALKMMG
jgi:hypothetical protein